MFLDKETISQIHQRIQNLPRISGHAIECDIQGLKRDSADTDKALQTLCDKRGCQSDKDTAGDNLPVKLLKAKAKELNDKIGEMQYIEYIPLQVALDWIWELQKETKEYHEFQEKQKKVSVNEMVSPVLIKPNF